MAEQTRNAVGETDTVTVVAKMADYPPLANQLRAVEAQLLRSTSADTPMLAESGAHLLGAGGKRIRPALTILMADLILAQQGAGLAGEADARDAAVRAGAACELVHLGSLHHDDVIDEAVTRRGTPSVNANWSNTVAVLSGDFLLARASELAAALGAEAAGILATTIVELVDGQTKELTQAYDLNTTQEGYYQAISGKTASLMATSCRLGALVAGGSDDDIERARRFGHELGVAFQIVDDILDLVATEEQTGKRQGIDLVEGVYTLPTLLALEADTKGEIRPLLTREISPDEVTHATERIVALGGTTAAEKEAYQHLQRCDDLLAQWSEHPTRDALLRLGQYVFSRLP